MMTIITSLLVFELEPMYATSDRQTDGRTDRRTTNADHCIMPPRRGHNKPNSTLLAAWKSLYYHKITPRLHASRVQYFK